MKGRTVHRSIATRLLLGSLASLALAAPAAAQTADPSRRDPRDRPPAQDAERGFEVDLHLGALRFVNYFQAAAGTPEEDVDAWEVELRLARALAERLEAYARLDYTDYQDLEASQGLAAGLRSEGGRQRFDVFAEALQNRPAFDVGDGVEQADVNRLAGEYSYRVTPDWQASATADLERQRFDLTTGRDNEYLAGGAFLRYRGFGSVFSPEVGAVWAERDADDRNEDHAQRDLFFKIRSAPRRSTYLTLRYRHRTRDYPVADPLAGNFAREDTRRQLVATADVRTGDLLVWTLYWSWEEADSTKPTRDYTTQLIALGVTFRLAEVLKSAF